MKPVNRNELERIANTEGAQLTFHPTACLDFGGYGFEATECNIDGDHWGFKFFGPSFRQKDVKNVWNRLTEDRELKPMLTPEAAKELTGQRVKLSYGSYPHILDVRITGMFEKQSNQIGQKTEKELKFIDYTDDTNGVEREYLYEWQGIFRCTGSAHIVYIESVE